MTTNLQTQIDRMNRQRAEAWGLMSSAKMAAKIETGAGPTLIIMRRSYAPGTDLDTILNDTATPTEVTLTEDGRGYIPEWHKGTEGASVYVERWTPEGLAFHGFVDAVSRRIVQTG